MLTGASVPRLSTLIQTRLNASRYAADRIVRTETAAMAAQADLALYAQSTRVTGYEFMATLDSRTDDTCGDLDGQVFPLAEATMAVNLPPIHPCCRCCTVPVFPDDEPADLRATRDDDGRSVLTPAKSFAEWKAQGNGSTVRPGDITRALGIQPVPIFDALAQASVADEPAPRVTAGRPLPRLAVPESTDLAASRTNPNYRQGDPGTSRNCQRCVVAWELRLRGYDVTAGLRTATNSKSVVEIMRLFDYKPSEVASAPTIQGTPAQRARTMEAITADYPVGATGFVSGRWRGPGAHIFCWEKTEAGIIWHEPQLPSTSSADAAQHLLHMKGGWQVFRTDNRPIALMDPDDWIVT